MLVAQKPFKFQLWRCWSGSIAPKSNHRDVNNAQIAQKRSEDSRTVPISAQSTVAVEKMHNQVRKKKVFSQICVCNCPLQQIKGAHPFT